MILNYVILLQWFSNVLVPIFAAKMIPTTITVLMQMTVLFCAISFSVSRNRGTMATGGRMLMCRASRGRSSIGTRNLGRY